MPQAVPQHHAPPQHQAPPQQKGSYERPPLASPQAAPQIPLQAPSAPKKPQTQNYSTNNCPGQGPTEYQPPKPQPLHQEPPTISTGYEVPSSAGSSVSVESSVSMTAQSF